jgi:hypothetical protein
MAINIYTANIDLTTGIAYGYISASCLDSDLVNELMDNGVNATADEAFKEWRATKADMLFETDPTIETIEQATLLADDLSHEFWESWEEDEPCVEGEHEGVAYASSWLGGALNFFIFKSPNVTEHARQASPCVPNAGILDTLNGDVKAYDVPADWRHAEFDV